MRKKISQKGNLKLKVVTKKDVGALLFYDIWIYDLLYECEP